MIRAATRRLHVAHPLFAFALTAALVGVACTQPFGGRPTQTADFVVERKLERAEGYLEARRYEEARELYRQLAEELAPHPYVRLARVRLARLDAIAGRRDAAIAALERLVREGRDDDAGRDARLLLGRLLADTSRSAEARDLLEDALAERPDAPEAPELVLRIGKIHEERGEEHLALRTYDRAIETATDPDFMARLRERVQAILGGFAPEQLAELATLYAGRYVGLRAEVMLAERSLSAGDDAEARARLESLLDAYRGEAGVIEAEIKLRELRETMPVSSGSIGAMLPLSGPYASFGQAALDGLMVAAEVFRTTPGPTSPGPQVSWVVRDTAGEPERAVALVDELVLERGVMAIIGPMVGSVAEAAASRANELGVPLITLTRKPLDALGEFVFRSSLPDELVTDALAELAVDEIEARRFAVLYPDDPSTDADTYGYEIRDAFMRSVRERGGDVVAVKAYDPTSPDFGEPIRKLIHGQSGAVEREGNELRVGFDALFIPGSPTTLALLAPQLAYYDLVAVQLLGTNAWNSSALVSQAGDFIQGALFVDGFFAESNRPATRAFADQFFLDFDHQPGLVEALGYEAGRLVLDVLGQGGIASRLDLTRALLALHDYEGVAGLVGFTASGECQRELEVLTVSGNRIVDLDWPAGAGEATPTPAAAGASLGRPGGLLDSRPLSP